MMVIVPTYALHPLPLLPRGFSFLGCSRIFVFMMLDSNPGPLPQQSVSHTNPGPLPQQSVSHANQIYLHYYYDCILLSLKGTLLSFLNKIWMLILPPSFRLCDGRMPGRSSRRVLKRDTHTIINIIRYT